VDNLVNGKRENIEGVDARLAVEDIRNTGEMERLLGGVDVVFHLACLGVRHSIHSPRENHDVNATADACPAQPGSCGGREAVRLRLQFGGLRHGALGAHD